jgi:Fic family protein
LKLGEAIQSEFRQHDPLIQALSLHYHFAAMHPFMDGNGRTARVLEALMLRRAGLTDRLFIAMSNYYYDEKKMYLEALAQVRAGGHDLTPFLVFGLRGVTLQCRRLFSAIKTEVSKSLYRNLMVELCTKLQSSRKRVIVIRQMEILKLLLDSNELPVREVIRTTESFYKGLGNPDKAVVRDINGLLMLGAIELVETTTTGRYNLRICLDWPAKMSETALFERVASMPTSKMHHAFSTSHVQAAQDQPDLNLTAA